jgi:DNA-binding MarR family transcriptional regulator
VPPTSSPNRPDELDPSGDLAAIGQACFALHARMTARLLSRHYDAAVRREGLTLAQFGLLGAIAHDETAAERPRSDGALAEKLGMERTTLLRNIRLLAARGWIERRADGGRGLQHRLTEEGRAVLVRAIPLWQTAQRQVEQRLAGIGADEARRAMRALRRASR